MSKSLDQERAAYAWKCVQGKNADYKNLAKSTPALIMSNGLMQTLAFLKSKDKPNQEHHTILGAQICAWAMTEKKPAPPENGVPFRDGFGKIMGILSGMNSEGYRRATEESLAILRWIRQLADAAIVGK